MTKLSQKQELQQQLTPRQIIQAALLQLNLPLLEQRILHEMEINPALEIIDSPNTMDAEDSEGEDNLEQDEDIEFDWKELLGQHEDYEYQKGPGNEENNLEIPLVARESFSEKYIKQLRDCNINTDMLIIAEEVLGNLDEQGYLNIEPMLISDRLNIDEQDVLDVMFKIQRLDPPGAASRNIQECLLTQAEIRNENPLAITILKKYFDDFANHRYEKILEGTECSEDKLNEAIEFIARLNPSPRDDQFIEGQDIVLPDVAIEERDGEFHVIIQEGSTPEIRVSKTYLKMLNDNKDKKDVIRFVKQKLESASWFVEAVQQRKHTIVKVMKSIIKHQPNYFHTGKRILRPMILKNIADDINMDISTVSRVSNGKYVQLPWEIKEIKTFFSEGIQMKSGELVSNTEVKKRLKEIIDAEDKKHPIGDEKLTAIINGEGYKIARRTIMKYREQLKYPIARLRRKL